MRTVGRDVQHIRWQSVVRKSIVQRTLAARISISIDADGSAVVIRLVRRAVGDGKSWHNFDILSRVAADLREVLQLLGGQRERLLSRVHRGYRKVGNGGDLHCLRGAAHGQRHVVLAPLPSTQANVGRFVGLKALRLHRELIRSNWHRREGEIALAISNCVARGPRQGIRQLDFSATHDGSRAIRHNAGQGSKNSLSPSTRAQQREQTQHHQQPYSLRHGHSSLPDTGHRLLLTPHGRS